MHWKLTPSSLSENLKVGFLSLDGSGGFAVIEGGGGRVSIVQINVAGSLRSCSALTARTSKLWAPSARFGYVFGLTQDEKSAGFVLSSRHSKSAGSLSEKKKVALGSSEGLGGPESIFGAGGGAAAAPAVASKTPTTTAVQMAV